MGGSSIIDMPAPKRKRGRPRTGRRGYPVTMLPTTFHGLCELAQADKLRLGAWLDAQVAAGLPSGDGIVSRLRRLRLLEVLRNLRFLIGEMDNIYDEDPDLFKDREVVEQLGELAITFPSVAGWLREAGFGDRIEPPRR
jgi:hypothetical protein